MSLTLQVSSSCRQVSVTFAAGTFSCTDSRRLFDHFAERFEIARRRFVKGQADNLVTGKAVDDFVERAVEKNFAVIDDDDAMTKLLDVLHVMAGQHGDDACSLIVDAGGIRGPVFG